MVLKQFSLLNRALPTAVNTRTVMPSITRTVIASRLERAFMRTFDIAFASSALVLALPVIIALVLALKLEAPGPALLRQRRVGADGRHIHVYQFRLRDSAVGKFIRETSLDELPQLLNVLLGDLSLMDKHPELLKGKGAI